MSRLESQLALGSLSIEAFRGLRGLRLTDFARVNLLVGDNNAGKTTVLEAIALYTRPGDFVGWGRASSLRWLTQRQAANWGRRLQYLFPARASERGTAIDPIHLVGTGARLAGVVRVSPAMTTRQQVPDGAPDEGAGTASFEKHLQGMRVDVSDRPGTASGHAEFELGGSHERSPSANGTFEDPEIALQTMPAFAPRMLSLTRLWSSVEFAGSAGAVTQLAREFEPTLESFGLLERDGETELYARVGGVLLPVGALGDGVRSALALGLGVQLARGGILLVDEIETAMHPSMLRRVGQWLLDRLRENDVQLFATTHSLEAVDSLVACAEDRPDDVAVYTLRRRPEGVVPYRVGGERLQRARVDRGMDVR